MAYASKQSSAYKLKQTETTPARAAKPQMELVPENKKRRQQAVIRIKKKFGKNAIVKGMNLEEGATAMDRNRQIGGHKA